ncbi:MAG: HAMP domain-containing methyl-accepting chemotaxis protein [Candidatus Sericytochromatia bacterium]
MKFNILSKIVSVFIALSIPSVFLISQIVSEKNQSIVFTQKEIVGTKYISHLFKTLKYLHQHNIQLHKSRLFNIKIDNLKILQDNIDKSLDEVEMLNINQSNSFYKSRAIFSVFRKDWKKLKEKEKGFSINKSEEVHQILIKNLISLIAEYSTESNLVLDLETDSYYLIDTNADKLVSTLNNISKLQDLLQEIISQKSVDADQRTGVVIFTGVIFDSVDKVRIESNRAFSSTIIKNLKKETSPLISSLYNNTNNFNQLSQNIVESKIISKDKLDSVESLASKSSDSVVKLFDLNIRNINILLNNRIDSLNTSKSKAIYLSIIIILIYLLFGAYVVLGIVRAIRELDNNARKISQGMLDVKTNIRTGDELESLSDSFNSMVDNINSSFKLIERAKNASEQNASNMEKLIKETSDSVTQIKTSSEIVADNAKTVAEASTMVVGVSTEGENAVKESIDGVEKIKRQIEAVATKILQLSYQTQEIGQVIDYINDIVVRSKFLAFNASIESSKAGEYGKGFAIVASEIKMLSEESKDSTEKITEILNEIQSLTNESVMMTEEGMKLADTGVDIAKNAGDSISKLVYTIQNSSEAAYQISSYVMEQNIKLEQLEDTMKKVSFVS